MSVGDLVRHIYTGRLCLVAGVGLYRHSVTLVGWPSNQVFNTVTDLELVSPAPQRAEESDESR